MTKEYFISYYRQMKSLERLCGCLPEVREFIDEAKHAGLDPEKLIAEVKMDADG